jgi:hypothetical protein
MACPGVLRSALISLSLPFREGIWGNGAYIHPTTKRCTRPPVPILEGAADNATLYAQILMQLFHVRLQLVVGDHVDDLPMLHHVVPVRYGLCKTEILLH